MMATNGSGGRPPVSLWIYAILGFTLLLMCFLSLLVIVIAILSHGPPPVQKNYVVALLILAGLLGPVVLAFLGVHLIRLRRGPKVIVCAMFAVYAAEVLLISLLSR